MKPIFGGMDGGMTDERMDHERFTLDVRRIACLGRQEGGRGCTICDLPNKTRHKLHMDLLSGVSYRDVAGRFSVTKSSVHRHLVLHLWPEVVRILGDEGELIGSDLMDAGTVINDLGAVRAAMAEISLDRGEETKDRVGASRAVAGISRTALELSGHLKGNQTNVAVINGSAVEGQVQPIISQIMTALANHPEAQLAVAEALDGGAVIEAKALPAAE